MIKLQDSTVNKHSLKQESQSFGGLKDQNPGMMTIVMLVITKSMEFGQISGRAQMFHQSVSRKSKEESTN